MDFEGAQYDKSFILADVQLESDLARDRVQLFLGDARLVESYLLRKSLANCGRHPAVRSTNRRAR